MRMPLKQMLDLGLYIRRKRRAGEKYFPLVLMVEYKDTIRDQMPLEEALASAEEAGAPIVSICGGEPLMYKHIVPLTNGLMAQKRHVMICTNALLLERFVKQVPPNPYLSFNIHLDGMRQTHDRLVDRPGVFDVCVRMIKLLKSRGYRVQTNSTIYRETSEEEVEELIRFLGELG